MEYEIVAADKEITLPQVKGSIGSSEKTLYLAKFGISVCDSNNTVCSNCHRGIYNELGRFFNRFPIKPVDNWIIMPLCTKCGNPATHYEGNYAEYRDTTFKKCYLEG